MILHQVSVSVPLVFQKSLIPAQAISMVCVREGEREAMQASLSSHHTEG